ncbi:NAD(P)-dependent oxidoreductase [Verrucomicrobiota bacterium sgz303538]
MDLYFIEHETSDCAYFENALKQHTLHFIESLAEVPADAQIVSVFIESKIDSAFLSQHPALRFVATRSTTSDHIDLEACAARGVTVSHVPLYGKYTVAEHTFALLLALSRRLRQAMEANRKRSFSYEALRGVRLRRKTLGVVGAGTIGLRVLHLARAFGMNCIACDIHRRPELAARVGFEYVEFSQLLACSDVISLHATLTPETYHMLNRETFAQCRPGVMIINTARGSLIESKALLEALDAGIVGGAGLDVLEDERLFHSELSALVSSQIIDHLHAGFPEREPRASDPERIKELISLVHNEELLSRPNVVFTPHIAYNSAEAIEFLNRTTTSNIEGFLNGHPTHVLVPKSSEGARQTSQGSPFPAGGSEPCIAQQP